MAWTITRVLWLALALSCQDGGEDDEPSLSDTPVDSSTLPTGETGVPTPTGDTGDPPDTTWPLCDHLGRTEAITLLGADRLDYAGFSVDAGDIDGDGCAEVAVAAPWEGGYQSGEGAVYLLALDGLTSGSIEEEAAVIWQEPDSSISWVDRVALVPPQIAWLTTWREEDEEGVGTVFKVLAYDLPDTPLTEVVGASERAGDVFNPGGYHHTANDIEDCSGLGTPTLCVGSASRGPEADFAGSIALYDMPLRESLSQLDFRTRIAAADGERAEMVEADDLDGDGLADLVIGAFYAGEGRGHVGLVSAPAEGDFLLWDVAFATLEGVVELGYAGQGLTTGDLDGDGHVDVWVGAPLPVGDVGHAYVMAGPFSGNRPLSEALVTVEGDEANQFVGVDGAIGDMDGDGAAELIVGAPYSPYFNTVPGTVAVFPSPSPGNYLVSDAPIQLTSGSSEPDAFGFAIAPADIDGDGLLDLAIGAPDDSRQRELAGSVTLVFGASL